MQEVAFVKVNYVSIVTLVDYGNIDFESYQSISSEQQLYLYPKTVSCRSGYTTW